MSARTLSAALAEIVGAGHVLDSPAALAACALDGIEPRWIVKPGSVEEVGRLLALASSERLAVAPRGSGARAGLGNPPSRLDLVVDLTRLSAVQDYVPEDMVATVQCGLTLSDLAVQLAKKGQRLALDPLGGGGRTVGGVLATNASGPLRFRYGTGRDLLLGVRFVQADGTITWGGSKVVKSVSGYDVPKLLVGSLGTLGVMVEATLRLHPLPAATGTVVVVCRSPAALQELLAAVLDSSLEPDRITALNNWVRGGGPPSPALLVSFGSVDEAVKSQGQALIELAKPSSLVAEWVPNTFWDEIGRGWGDPPEVSLTLVCEIRRVGHWLGELERLASALGTQVFVVGEGGNGVLRASLGDGAAERPFLRELIEPLRDGLEAEGGSVVVERMPPALKRDFDVWGAVPADALALMRRVKQEFDPLGLLNPGRFVGGL
ncbi:MAG TPA: FAD-binding oxidoreductase [Methylomirabilota bacterium]|nr:FAD-binding oxidoreductase [Methylomirabilota bacterium]